MTSADYFEIGARVKRGEAGYVMSQSSLKLFAQNPAAWVKGRKVELTKSMEWGNLLDVIYLTPDLFKDSYAIFPKVYPSPTKADQFQEKPWNMTAHYCQQWAEKAKKEGRFPIYRNTFDAAKVALERLHEHEIASALRDDCDTQVVCQWEWTDTATGITVPLKGMLDLAPDDADYLADFKSSVSSEITGFRRMAAKFRYDLQGAFYQWGFRECYRDTSAFALIVSESKAPYPVATYNLTPRDLSMGRYGGRSRFGKVVGFQEMLQNYCRCLESGHWPELNSGNLTPLDLYPE